MLKGTSCISCLTMLKGPVVYHAKRDQLNAMLKGTVVYHAERDQLYVMLKETSCI